MKQAIKNLGLGSVLVAAFALAGCSTATPQTQVASAGCEGAGDVHRVAQDHLAPGKVRAVSQVKETEFRARALTPERTVGADIYVHAQPGVTAEYLERALSCHASSGTAVGDNDPLLPGTGAVAQVKVRSAQGGFAVRAVGSSPEAAQQIWSRAKSFTAPNVTVEQVASQGSPATF